MATITVDGLEELMNDLKAVSEIPDSVANEMLDRQADIVIKAQKSRISSIGLVDSGQLMRSIQKDGGMKKRAGTRSVEISPVGVRINGVRNAEVGFIHEYGAKGKHIPAKNWMQQANESCADKAVEAAREVYDEFLKSKNL